MSEPPQVKWTWPPTTSSDAIVPPPVYWRVVGEDEWHDAPYGRVPLIPQADIEWRAGGARGRFTFMPAQPGGQVILSERQWWKRLANKRDRLILAYLNDLIGFIHRRLMQDRQVRR